MKKFLFVLFILSTVFSDPAFADRSGTYRGRGAARSSRRASGTTGSKHFCFPVGNCVNHKSYYDAQKFLTYNTDFKSQHLGEDWNHVNGGNSDLGQPVYAAGAGIVSQVGNFLPGWGKVVIILHQLSDGTKVNTLYAHLDQYFVKKGDVVALHQKIGTIGLIPGKCDQPAHLHFELRKNEFDLKTPGKGYSTDKKVHANYLNPTAFITSHLPPLYTQRPNQACIGDLKKMGGIYKCTNTPQGGVVSKGETLSPLVTIDNVWVDHHFVVTVTHNKKTVVDKQVSALKKVDTEYGWSTTQMVKQIKNAEPGEWRFIYKLRYSLKGATVEKKLGEIVYQVKDKLMSGGKETTQSLPWFLLKSTEVCKKFGGGKHTDWVYNCIDPKDVYEEGESFYILVGIMNVLYDHRFVIDSSLDGVHKWTYKSGWNNVTAGNMWKHAYFWPQIKTAQAGTWSFIFHLEFKDKSMVPIVKKTVIVKKKTSIPEPKKPEKPKEKAPEKQPEKETPQKKPEQDKTPVSKAPYKYDSTKICSSIGGPDKDWKYWCIGGKTSFPSGTTKVHVLSKLTDVFVNHRFKIEVYKNNYYLWEWNTKWSAVDAKSGWKYSHFFPYIGNLSSGSWKVKIYVITATSQKMVAEKSFTILGSTKPSYTPAPEPLPQPKQEQKGAQYVFKSVKACGNVTGGSSTGWNYTCINEKTKFKVGDTAHLLAHFVDLKTTHRFKVVTRKNNMLKWNYVSPWNNVVGGWKYAFFFPKHNNLTFGGWTYDFFIQTKDSAGISGFKYVGTVKISVKY